MGQEISRHTALMRCKLSGAYHIIPVSARNSTLDLYNQRGGSLSPNGKETYKSKGDFPTDDSIRKAIFLSVKEISKKWTMPSKDWVLAYNQIKSYFADRFARRMRGGLCLQTRESTRKTHLSVRRSTV